MKINSYNNKQYISIKEKSEEHKNTNVIQEHENNMNSFNSTDSIEISEDLKQLNSIKNKIEIGYYDNPNVLKKVAEKILNTMDEKV